MYARDDKLYFECCGCDGYPLRRITSAEVVSGGWTTIGLTATRITGVRIRGSDGTTILFATSIADAQLFVQELRVAVEAARKRSEVEPQK